jgi:hypothetical protein
VIAALLSLALVSVSVDRPLPEERELLARRMETLRRILPDGPNVQADTAHVRELATSSGLGSVDALARPPTDSGKIGSVTVDLTATGSYLAIEQFFRKAEASPRLIDVENLDLTGSQSDVMRLRTVLRLPFRPVSAPLAPVPDGVRGRTGGMPRAVADAFLRDHALAVAKTEAIVTWRRARRNPRGFLCELAAVVRDRPVILWQANLEGQDFRVRGMALGGATIQALDRRFERGLFRLSSFTVARQGACQHFEARGRSPVVGPETDLPLPSEDPFAQDESPCLVERDPARTIGIKGPRPTAKRHGPLTIRLRGVDAADAFQILAQLTSQAFLVDGDVVGRVSGDLVRVTAKEAEAALAKEGLVAWGDGPVRRVSLKTNLPRRGAKGERRTSSGKSGRGGSAEPHPSSANASGQDGTPPAGMRRISLSLKRAEIRDVLAALADVDSAYVAFGPQGPLGRASLWIEGRALRDVWAAVLGAARLSERFEEGRRLLERNPGSLDVLVPVAATPPDTPRLVLGPRQLTVGEMDLVAVAAGPGGWRAYAYTPTGMLLEYRTGDKLADASLRSIDSTDVVLDTEDGAIRVLLPAR